MKPCGCPDTCSCRRKCGCFGAESCHRCIPSAGLWLTLGAVGVLAAVSEGARRAGSRNTGSSLADAIIADEANVGTFYEEVLQPFLWSWAGREAKQSLHGGSLHSIDIGAWEDLVRQWVRWSKTTPSPSAGEIGQAARILERHFDSLWHDWAEVRVEEQIYPPERPASRRQRGR